MKRETSVDVMEGMSEQERKYFICQRLSAYAQSGKLYFFRVNAGGMKADYKNKIGGMKTRFIKFAPAGMSDIIVFFNGGKTVFVEIKDEGGKQRDSQVKFQTMIEALGYDYCIVRTVNDIEAVVQENI